MRTSILVLYYPRESLSAQTMEFKFCKYIIGETLETYAYRLELKLDQALPQLDGAANEQVRTEMFKSQFISGFPEPYRT